MTRQRLPSLFLLLVLGLGLSAVVEAAIEVFQFDDSAQEDRFRKLTEELRCLVCQNQNLADSNAELAQDLRHQVYTMVKSGQSNKEIVAYMVNRYGDFVLYRPPVQSNTLLLWLGPFIIFAGAVVILLVVVRRRHAAARTDLSTEDQQRLRKLLEEGGSGSQP